MYTLNNQVYSRVTINKIADSTTIFVSRKIKKHGQIVSFNVSQSVTVTIKHEKYGLTSFFLIIQLCTYMRKKHNRLLDSINFTRVMCHMIK